MGFQNHRLQYGVDLGSQRYGTASLGVESTPGHTERPGKNHDGILELQHVHGRILGNDSLRSLEFSANNSLTDGTPGIVATSSSLKFESQFPIVPLGIPSFFPTSDWVSPLELSSSLLQPSIRRCRSFVLSSFIFPVSPGKASVSTGVSMGHRSP